MATTCIFSPADCLLVLLCYRICLIDIVLSEWMSVAMHLDTQSFESFYKIMVRWLKHYCTHDMFLSKSASADVDILIKLDKTAQCAVDECHCLSQDLKVFPKTRDNSSKRSEVSTKEDLRLIVVLLD